MIDDLKLEDFEVSETEDDNEADEAINIVKSAVITLFCACDGATTEDAQGFAAFDVYHGHRIGRLIEADEDLKPEDVQWIRKHLRYYKNTQLSYIDWTKWDGYCDFAFEYYATIAAEEQKKKDEEQARIDAERAEISVHVETLDRVQVRKLFLSIRHDVVSDRDYSFLVSLQTYGRPWSDKQYIWVKKLLVKYWKGRE